MGNVSTVRARIMIISSAWLVAACTPQLTEVSIPRPATTVPAATTTISMVDIPVPSESTLPEAPDHRDPNLDPPGTMVVTPSDDLVSIVANAPDGSTIRFSEGLYRGVMIEVRAGMTFLGDEGAVLRGSVLIEGFVPEGDGWAAPAPVQPATEPEQGPEWGWCDDDRPACVFPEQVFMDDTTLLRVTSAAELGPGRWYLDGTRVVVGDDPAGRDVEISSLPYAFWGDADGITVDGLVMERYATPGRQGVVNPRIGRIGPAGLGWV
ncbi:MAG: hypothetical protein OEW91_05995, partial [Acidimicrobiia bacterium]|nr:hypothetical protein [Acidimicrobiia bacterium]